MADANRDGNFVPTLIATSSADGRTPVDLWADPDTHRLLIDASAGAVTDVTATAPLISSGGTTPDISTSMNTNKLIGRGTAGTGVMEEITLGTNLSLTGTTLNAAGGGTVTSVSGTTNRITSTGGTTPVIDISATFEALLGKVANPLSQFAATTSAQLAGVISDETGSGSLVFATSPVLTTPTITTKISPTTDDGAPLGDTTHNFSDLFLASGGVINFNNSDVTITHSSNLLTLAGGQFSFGANTAYFAVTDNGNSGTSDTIDWTLGNKQKSTLTGNCTFTFTAPGGPCNLILELVQDGTVRTITWPASVKWSGGTPPTMTGTSGRSDIVSFYYNGTVYYGTSSLNYVNS